MKNNAGVLKIKAEVLSNMLRLSLVNRLDIVCAKRRFTTRETLFYCQSYYVCKRKRQS